MFTSLRLQAGYTVCVVALVVMQETHTVATEKGRLPEEKACISHLDSIWNRGDRQAYYRQAIRLAKEIQAMPPSRRRVGIAADLLENLLSREGPVPEARNGDLSVMGMCAMPLTFDSHSSMNERRAHAGLLARFLGRVRGEIIQDYTPKPASEHVDPPPGEGIRYSGMPLAQIEDPIERAQYEDAIRQNQANMLMNNRQDWLRIFNKARAHFIVSYLIDCARREAPDSALVAEWIENSSLTVEEQRDVERAAGSATKEHDHDDYGDVDQAKASGKPLPPVLTPQKSSSTQPFSQNSSS